MANGLRALADVIEQYGGENWPLPYAVEVSVDVGVSEYTNVDGKWQTVYDTEATKKALRKALKGMGVGKKEKTFGDWLFSIRKDFGGDVALEVHANRASVCVKVPTGNKIIRESTTYTTPRTVEEEYVWECNDGTLLRGVKELT